MKKNIINILLLLLPTTFYTQIAIGKANITGTSTILDFDNSAGNTRGIILPAVQNSPVYKGTHNANNGTFIFDQSTSKIRMYQNDAWIDISSVGSRNNIMPNTSPGSSLSIIMGSSSSAAKGVLILESSNKAVILPQITNPHTSVANPYPGMMCYDRASKSVAFFDGKVWNYWK
ncbi:hypothetical protein QWZ06_16160 [Chryseobacterium tructae]|uniref:WG repeat-containing protein n=1 Tax=Chryseobacterium tructae TaxID=1037380 RepID=A0ABV7Y1J7_9FLAO|nr:hypothetical protein [Chryseobacterium tructae]MDN3693718.1 hypothetical protein [Chryseobacterium tructae]